MLLRMLVLFLKSHHAFLPAKPYLGCFVSNLALVLPHPFVGRSRRKWRRRWRPAKRRMTNAGPRCVLRVIVPGVAHFGTSYVTFLFSCSLLSLLHWVYLNASAPVNRRSRTLGQFKRLIDDAVRCACTRPQKHIGCNSVDYRICQDFEHLPAYHPSILAFASITTVGILSCTKEKG